MRRRRTTTAAHDVSRGIDRSAQEFLLPFLVAAGDEKREESFQRRRVPTAHAVG